MKILSEMDFSWNWNNILNTDLEKIYFYSVLFFIIITAVIVANQNVSLNMYDAMSTTKLSSCYKRLSRHGIFKKDLKNLMSRKRNVDFSGEQY